MIIIERKTPDWLQELLDAEVEKEKNQVVEMSKIKADQALFAISIIEAQINEVNDIAEKEISLIQNLMLAPGSGLGCAFIDSRGLPLDGDTLAGMEGAHIPAPLHLLETKAYPCGCGRTWGCTEVYTTISGLPYLLNEKLVKYPDHQLAKSPLSAKEKVLSLRGLAQKGDPLAVEIFDFQAKAMGLLVATLTMVLDAEFVVIGGGLMDPESTTEAFRHRYLQVLRETMEPYLWPAQRGRINIVPAALGELSQAIGAALVALYQSRS
jgi:glucokinase